MDFFFNISLRMPQSHAINKFYSQFHPHSQNTFNYFLYAFIQLSCCFIFVICRLNLKLFMILFTRVVQSFPISQDQDL